MSTIQFLFAILILATVEATTLTYQVSPGEDACFYALVPDVPKRLSFYFAVQSGGSFDIDYRVTDSLSKVLLQGTKERQGDFVFAANSAGEHAFCFNNDMSSFTSKLVDFDILVCRSHFHKAITACVGPR